MRKDDLTVSLVAFPPVSRKLAQWPPWRVRASTVFIARPAPFTVMYQLQPVNQFPGFLGVISSSQSLT